MLRKETPCLYPHSQDYVDGSTPSGSSAYEKRGIAVKVPVWNPDNCIQCNFCAYVCPHAVIRPVAMTADEAAKAPADMKMKDMTGMPGYKFAITVSAWIVPDAVPVQMYAQA